MATKIVLVFFELLQFAGAYKGIFGGGPMPLLLTEESHFAHAQQLTFGDETFPTDIRFVRT